MTTTSRATTPKRTSTEQRERELKFDVPDGWDLAAVPEPATLVPPGGSLQRDVIHLESTYFDTPDRSLLDAGLTLRRRTGDADVGWQLKVPDGEARTEVRLPLDGPHVPDELRELTLGAGAGGQLQPVATLVTDRVVLRIEAPDRSGLAEIAVDSVSAHGSRRDERTGGDIADLRQWREVEIELLGGDETLLRRAASWLRKTGARPSRSKSKLARALGTPTRAPGRRGLGGLVAAYLDEQREAILRGDLDLRRGHDVIHRTRVGTRRYRSVLRVFADVLDTDRAAALDAELKWYAQVLGEVRDREVMRTHLDAQLDAIPDELVLGPVRARIHRTLDAELADARAALDEVLHSERYFALLREIAAWHDALPLREAAKAKAVDTHLAHAERTVRRRLRRAESLPAGDERDAAMHRARKAAKRARYTAELAQPRVGARAAKSVKRLKKLQDRLGDRQDGVVAAEFLR